MTGHTADTPLYTIGTAARVLGISVQTLRLYENEGLIAPHKSNGGHRLYSDADLDRVRCLRKAINEEKISIGGIRRIQGMIPCWQIIGCPADQRDACPAFRNHAGGCWTYKHEHSVCATKECRLCEVYKRSSDCGTVRDLIIRSTVHP